MKNLDKNGSSNTSEYKAMLISIRNQFNNDDSKLLLNS
jgi:hypothetical protein